MNNQNELTVVLNEDELRAYLEAGVPLEQLRMATPEEQREFEKWEREGHEEWLREQEFNAAMDAIDLDRGMYDCEDWWVDDDGVLRAPWESDDDD